MEFIGERRSLSNDVICACRVPSLPVLSCAGRLRCLWGIPRPCDASLFPRGAVVGPMEAARWVGDPPTHLLIYIFITLASCTSHSPINDEKMMILDLYPAVAFLSFILICKP